jgi:O-antigen/teichoic acid export membrane protein
VSEDRPTGGRRVIAVMSGASLVQSGGAALAGLWATVVLGAEARGVMVIAVTTAGAVGLIAGLGTSAAFRAILPTADPDERHTLTVAFGSVSLLSAAGAAVISVGILLLTSLGISDDLAEPTLLAVVALAAFLQCLATQANEGWWADGHFARGSILAATGAALGFVGLVLAGVARETPAVMLGGQVLGEGSVAVVSVLLLHRAGLFRVGRRAGAEMRRLVRMGWPTLGGSVGAIVTFRADRYLIGVFVGPAAITVYSLAATLSEVCRTVPHQLGQVLIRRIAVRDESVVLRRTVVQAIIATAVTGLAIGVVGWVAIPAVFDDELHDARNYLLLLLGAEVLFAPFFIAGRGLVGGGWTKATGIIGALGSVFAVLAYLALVPPFGLLGACLASAIAYLALSVVSVATLSDRLRNRRPVDQTAAHADPAVAPVTP